MADLIQLPILRRYSDLGLLLLRRVVGLFLVWGVWDNIVSSERMQEFAAFLARFRFPWPELMARLSVWVQFAVGIGFVAGLLTRWAGILCAVNFTVALLMVDRLADIRGAFPSACLIAIGVYLALYGAGRFGFDSLLQKRIVR